MSGRRRTAAAVLIAALLVSACGGAQTTPSPASSPAGSPAASPAMSPAESPPASPAASASPAATSPGASPTSTGAATAAPTATGTAPAASPIAVSGDLFAFGVTYEQADEIGKVRIDYFREQHPEVNLTVSESDFTPEGFLTAMQTDAPPDVIRLDRPLVADYALRDLLMPLEQCFSSHGVNPADRYYQGVLDQVTIDGQLYAVPDFLTTQNWFVNASAFEDAGLDPQAFDFSNWEDIRGANEQLLQRDGQDLTRIGFDPKLPEYLPLWAKANGADLISEDGQTAQFDDPRVAEALQFGIDLINAHGGRDVFLNFRQTFDPFGESNQWATDRAAAHPYENFFLNALLGSTTTVDGELQWSNGERLDLQFRQFVGRDGSPLTYATGTGLAITTRADNPDAACAFVLGITDDEAWVRAAQERKRLRDESGSPNTGTFTANRIANDRIFGEVLDVSALPPPFDEGVRVFLDNLENSFALPPTPGGVAIFQGDNSIMAQAVARALDGEDVATVLRDADEEAQAAIDEAR